MGLALAISGLGLTVSTHILADTGRHGFRSVGFTVWGLGFRLAAVRLKAAGALGPISPQALSLQPNTLCLLCFG